MQTLALVLAMAAIGLAERLPRLRFEPLRSWRRGSSTDVVCLVTGALGLGLLVREVTARLVEDLGRVAPPLALLPLLAAVPLAVLLYDLLAYATHLALHRSESLWRLHKVHHSSPALDWLATFRAHVLEHGLRHLASTGALLVLGLPPAAVAAAATVYGAWAMLNHANLRIDLGFLEPVLITPRLHRLHHVATTGERNLGTIFSFWDRLRGTLRSEAGPGRLGVPGELDSYPQTWPRQLVEPFRLTRRRRPSIVPW